MALKHFILATAGHVDHGKSSLVKALTGIDPDRLPEEKARGITIELGFAHLTLPAPAEVPGGDAFEVGIVDVPGHEDFVKNMVAGVGSIDLALFIVAADDGWMPQSEEHLQILCYLGVTRAVIALTKIDLVPGNEDQVVRGVREALQGSPFADAPLVKTSAATGQGIDELKLTLAKVLDRLPIAPDIGKPRLPVDRVFSLRGLGTVVTGTLTGGTLKRGQAVVVQPSGKATRIRNIQSYNRDVESSSPGTRTALNLPDIAVGGKGHSQPGETISRGDVITLPDSGGSCRSIDVFLERSPRLLKNSTSADRPLKSGAVVRLHHGSANYSARVLLPGPQLLPGEHSLARLRFQSPVFLFAGDRFIVRDWPEQATLAGGIVLDPDSWHKNFHTQAQQTFLETRAHSPTDVTAFAGSQLLRDKAVPRASLLLKSRFSAAQVADAVAQLAVTQKVTPVAQWLVDTIWWNGLLQKTIELIQAEHTKNPDRPGLPLNTLRSFLGKERFATELFDPLMAALQPRGLTVENGAIRQRTHRPTLPPQLVAPGNALRAALAAIPLEPPSRKELAPNPALQQALRFLVQTGEVVELRPEVILSTEAFARATDLIRKFLVQNGSATVSDLRQLLGTSRRIMVPLLERLDRDGVTLRQGDKRILKPRA